MYCKFTEAMSTDKPINSIRGLLFGSHKNGHNIIVLRQGTGNNGIV